MEQLTYLVNWGKNKETAWSGTNYSLYNALRRFYSVKDINLKHHPKIERKISKILGVDGATIDYYYRHLASFMNRKIKGNVFQFSEILSDDEHRNTYLYVDQTVSYVNYMYQNLPEIVDACGLLPINEKILAKRFKEQEEYIRSCSGVFTMGHWLRNWLIEQSVPAEKIHAVGGGANVNTELILPTHKDHNKILFIGKDFKRKGGHITYEAFKLLRGKGHNVELYVIGPKTDPIEHPINGYHFIGQIPFSEEAKYYNMCDLFCMPSYFEAYGLVFVEALTFGLPCIGRNCYEMPYFIEDGNTGLLLRHDDAEELADLMMRILNDDSFAEHVMNNRKWYINNYSWDSVARRIAQVIG